MPQSYATRTGEASCELPESQQTPRASPDKELLPRKDSARKKRASKVLEATES